MGIARKYAIVDRVTKKIKRIYEDRYATIESCQIGEEVVEAEEFDSPLAIYWLPEAPKTVSLTTRGVRVWKLCIDWSGGRYTLKGKKIYEYWGR